MYLNAFALSIGWIEFRICPVNNPTVRATQQCLDRYVLPLVDVNGNPQTSEYGSTKTPVRQIKNIYKL